MPGPWIRNDPHHYGYPLPPDVRVGVRFGMSRIVNTSTVDRLYWQDRNLQYYRVEDADSEGWLPFEGGGRPVPADTLVEVRLADSGQSGHLRSADTWTWDVRYNNRITHYRFHRPGSWAEDGSLADRIGEHHRQPLPIFNPMTVEVDEPGIAAPSVVPIPAPATEPVFRVFDCPKTSCPCTNPKCSVMHCALVTGQPHTVRAVQRAPRRPEGELHATESMLYIRTPTGSLWIAALLGTSRPPHSFMGEEGRMWLRRRLFQIERMEEIARAAARSGNEAAKLVVAELDEKVELDN